MAKRVKIKPRILQDKVVRLDEVSARTWDLPKGGVVYLITHVGDGRKYVGLDSKPPNRLLQHARGTSETPYIHNAIRKYGAVNFTAQILAAGITEFPVLCALEKSLVAVHNCNTCRGGWGFNMTDGGEGTSGYKHTDEGRAKIGEANRGEKSYWFGKPKSPEWRAAQRERMRKYYAENPEQRAWHSAEQKKYWAENPERRAAYSEMMRGEKNPNHGKPKSPETRAAMSDSAIKRWADEGQRAAHSESIRGRRLVIIDGKRCLVPPQYFNDAGEYIGGYAPKNQRRRQQSPAAGKAPQSPVMAPTRGEV